MYFVEEKVSGERLISYGIYCQFRTRDYSMAATSMKTILFWHCLVAVAIGSAASCIRQSRLGCLYLENRFATNVSKLNARVR